MSLILKVSQFFYFSYFSYDCFLIEEKENFDKVICGNTFISRQQPRFFKFQNDQCGSTSTVMGEKKKVTLPRSDLPFSYS